MILTRTKVRSIWFIIGWVQYLNGVQSNSTKSHIYNALKAKLEQDAANCTKYIPSDWIQWMQVNNIPKDISDELTMGSEELFLCLHGEILNVNYTSPFELTDKDEIKYSMTLNEVVSLGFDGILVTKA